MRLGELAMRSDPPNWREILERMCGRLADWETDYEPDPHRRCVEELYDIFSSMEEHWQDYSAWELYGAPDLEKIACA
jgi:hypothetical protein